MKRIKNKSKWYKSKGGWIAVVSLIVILNYARANCFINLLNLCGKRPFFQSLGELFSVFFSSIGGFLFLAGLILVGLSVGNFIQKKFFKRKR